MCCLVQNNGEWTKLLITYQKNMNMDSQIIMSIKCDRMYNLIYFGTNIYFFIGILLFKTLRAPSICWSISTFQNNMFIVIMLTNNEKLWPWKSCWKINIFIYNYLWRESCDHWLVMNTIKWRNSQKTPSLVVHKNVWRYGIPYRHIKLRLMQYE